ncbi:MAG: ATP-grasp domain-containing protein [Thermoproteus sp.]|uniref:Alpha-L-glutamate ligase, RimK family n=1 Tax=Thermoproteus uzoniensis (strain 768-20) TaxID=999630 RepID=F2L3W3_THEU7|nr:RimK family alpha-L-glutamate ligase [Thermoproteus uzoniensis]AEA13275.1 alpha-L-glutamate ligase, RimK family [Thermoproteus uzoniensis 768-20]
MEVLVVAESSIPDEPTRDVLLELKKRGISSRYAPIQRLSVRMSQDGVFVETRRGPIRPDVVVIRGIGFLLDANTMIRRVTTLEILEEEGATAINPVRGLMASRDKLMSLYILRKAKIPVPPTVVTEDLFYAYNATKALETVVVKPIQGSRGFGAMLFSDPDLAFQVMRTLLISHNPLYIQKYVEKPNRDIRVIVVDGRAIGCMYRISTMWKTNIAQGARAEPCALNPELEDIAVRATKALGLVYAGIDVGEAKDGYVVFEVNASPDWRGFKSSTGINPAQYIVEYIASLKK